MTFLLILLLCALLVFIFMPADRGRAKNQEPVPVVPEPEIDRPPRVIPQEISYSPLTEEIRPQSLEDIDGQVLRSIEEKISILGSLPTASSKLLGLLEGYDASSKKIASFVATDPVLSARILQTVNSGYYGLPKKVTSIGTAIVYLGYNEVRSLVIQDSLYKTIPFKKDDERDLFNALWIHSTVVSACAYHLGQNVLLSPEIELSTIGLLHDVAKYFLNTMKVVGEKDDSQPSIVQEERVYGINHALLGSLIAKRWELPDIISNCIEYHHYPMFAPFEKIPEPYRKLSFIVCLADIVCNVLGYRGSSKEIFPVRNEYFEEFGVSPNVQELFTPDLLKRLARAQHTVQYFMNA